MCLLRLVMLGAGLFFTILPANGAAVDTKITLSGSSTIAPLVLEFAKLFEQENPGVRVDVQTGGSSRGIADARRQLVNIGMASRPLGLNDADMIGHTIAVDGVGLLVHKDNPVKNLSTDQVRGILTGSITDWQQVGGTPGKIVMVNRADGRSEVELISEFLNIKAKDIKAHLIVGENAHAIKTIAGSPQSITYISVGHAIKEQDHGVPVALTALNGIAATAETVSSGAFPMARPLNLVTKGKPLPMEEKFIAFAKSKKVYGLIQNQSFVPAPN